MQCGISHSISLTYIGDVLYIVSGLESIQVLNIKRATKEVT